MTPTTRGLDDAPAQDQMAIVQTVRSFLAGETPDWWFTGTFRRAKTSAQGARVSFQSWLRPYPRSLSGKLPYLASIFPPPFRLCVWSVEKQSRGTAHLHALLVGGQSIPTGHCVRCRDSRALTREAELENPPLTSADFPSDEDFRTWNPHMPAWNAWRKSWEWHYGYARCYPYDKGTEAGVVNYTLRYILSENTCDWELWELGKDY